MWCVVGGWIGIAAAEPPQPSTPGPKVETGATAKSTAVQVNGEVAPPPLLAMLEQTYGVQVPPGAYWYDPVSGLWGNRGEPPSGQILPGLGFAPLSADASGGSGGVIINGRVLHAFEVQWLVATFGSATPGRYWLLANGNLGVEGHPMPIVNLYATAGAAGGGGGQRFHHSNATGTTISSSGGSGYILFDDGSGVSW